MKKSRSGEHGQDQPGSASDDPGSDPYNLRYMRTSTLLRAEEFARVAEVLGPCELENGEIVPNVTRRISPQ